MTLENFRIPSFDSINYGNECFDFVPKRNNANRKVLIARRHLVGKNSRTGRKNPYKGAEGLQEQLHHGVVDEDPPKWYL